MIFLKSGCYILAAALVLCLVGCTTESAMKNNRMQVESILLLPVSSVHDELLVGADIITQVLEKQLKSADFDVYYLPESQIKTFEVIALEQSGSLYDPKIKKFVPLDKSKYNYHLIGQISQQYDFDAILMPQLWLRKTRMNLDEAQWDGVSRDIEFINKPEMTYKLPKSAQGLSLRLSAFSRRGGKIDSSYGGLSLPYRIDYQDGKAGFDLKKEFYSSNEVKEAVKIVLNQLQADIRAK